MAEDLEEIHYSLRITLDVMDLLRAIEKYFGGNANYEKGKGALFMNWMGTWHKKAYLYGVSRACGGNRQDIGVEGAIAVFMNLPYYLEFLVWRIRCGHDTGILERNLFLMLSSVEVVSFLRVLCILHISICMPLRWLTANCGDLEQYKFGVAEMPDALDLMDKAFDKVVKDGKKIMNEKFMMGIFGKLTRKIAPFKAYLTEMYEDKYSNLVGPTTKEEKVLPWAMLRSELFYPSRIDVLETNTVVPELGSEAAARFRVEFRDEKKATAKYLSAIGGEKSMKKVSMKERKAGRGIDASNSVSESGHAGLHEDLDKYGTIDLQNAAAAPQARRNNDFGREIDLYIQGRKAIKKKKGRGVGNYHVLPYELQRTAMFTSKWQTNSHKNQHRVKLKCQFDIRREKEQMIMEKKLDMAREDYIDGLALFEQYHSKRRWKSKEEAIRIWDALNSESTRLESVKVRLLAYIIFMLKHYTNQC